MNYFWDSNWQHIILDNKHNADEKFVIIKKLCFGPIETIEYGITNDLKYYFEHQIIEGLE